MASEISGGGSGEEIQEGPVTTGFSVQGINWNSTGMFPYTSSNNVTMWMDKGTSNYKFILYIGGGLAILSCLFALFSSTSSRKFRVKRSHMISINLCVSLIIFYVGILMSVSTANTSGYYRFEHHRACIAGASIFQLGIFYVWTWIVVHWGYLTYTVRNISAMHISHFVTKTTIPAFGVPSVLTSVIVIVNFMADDKFHVSSRTCLFNLKVAVTSALNFTYLAICFVFIAVCITYCVLRITCKQASIQIESTRLRIRTSVTRLSLITCGVLIISILELIRGGVVTKYSGSWFEIFNYVVLGSAGIIVSIGLALRKRELRLYLAERTSSSASVRRMMDTMRQTRKHTKRRSAMKRKGQGSLNSQTDTPVMCDTIRPPQLIPRESNKFTFNPPQNIKPPILVPYLHEKALKNNDYPEKVNENKVENFSSDDQDEAVDQVPEKVKINGAVSHINSLRERMLMLTNRRSIQPQSIGVTPNPSTPQPAPRRGCRAQVIPDDYERSSLASLDICRKTSF